MARKMLFAALAFSLTAGGCGNDTNGHISAPTTESTGAARTQAEQSDKGLIRIAATQSALREFVRKNEGREMPFFYGRQQKGHVLVKGGRILHCPTGNGETKEACLANMMNKNMPPYLHSTFEGLECLGSEIAGKGLPMHQANMICVSVVNQEFEATMPAGNGQETYIYAAETGVPFYILAIGFNGERMQAKYFDFFPSDPAQTIDRSETAALASEDRDNAYPAERSVCVSLRAEVARARASCQNNDPYCRLAAAEAVGQLLREGCSTMTPEEREREAQRAAQEIANKAKPRPQSIVAAIDDTENQAAAIESKSLALAERQSSLSSKVIRVGYIADQAVERAVSGCKAAAASVRPEANAREGFDDKGEEVVLRAANAAAEACNKASVAIDKESDRLNKAEDQYLEMQQSKRANANAAQEQKNREFESLVRQADDLFLQGRYAEALAMYERISNSDYGRVDYNKLYVRKERARDMRYAYSLSPAQRNPNTPPIGTPVDSVKFNTGQGN